MNKFYPLVLLLVGWLMLPVLGQKPTQTENPQDQWQIKWSASDEFNNSTPNWSKWIKTGNLPNTTAWKWNNQDNVKIKNNAAELTMRQNPNNANDGGTYFKSSILKSYQTFTYGYYEAKIKGASIGEGVCPSFWLYSNFDYSVPNGKTVYSEIDIVELQQFDWWDGDPNAPNQDDIQDIDLNLHAVVMENDKGVWRRPKQHPEEQLNKWRAPWDPRDDYHIYGCEVNETNIIWYIDGVEVARKPNIYWHRPMNVTLSLGLRKPFVEFYNNRNNAVNPETNAKAKAALPGMPTTMFVDYVRVWEKVGTSTTPTLPEGQLGNGDFETGSLDYWNAGSGTSSVVSNNVRSGSHAATVTNASIAQIVQLNPNTSYTIEGYAKVDSNGNKAYMGVSKSLTNELVKNFEFNSTNYSKGTITFTTGNTSEGYRIWFWSGNNGQSYIDDVSLAISGDSDSDEPVDSVLPTIGQTIWLEANNGKYLTNNTNSGTAIQSTKSSIGSKEQFLIIDANDNYVAFKNIATGRYLTTSSNSNSPLKCGSTGVFQRQMYSIEPAGNDKIAIKAKVNGLYASSTFSNNNAVQVKSSSIGKLESFRWGSNSSSREVKTNDVNSSLDIENIYPNPTTGILNINCKKENELFQLLDISGQIILNDLSVGKVDISQLESGTYFLKGSELFLTVIKH
ncbi:family 16 glycosylhydrolase [Reichenbachiella versicolor]|uniref:family 16 glycosylhydrolase n=1 Tax=Reichenbachiella versicolor TaxID=1821036 RepID=UPI0013A5753C|nr:family 16 glycosylhydrolase [Reichenbachiella versicolor]